MTTNSQSLIQTVLMRVCLAIWAAIGAHTLMGCAAPSQPAPEVVGVSLVVDSAAITRCGTFEGGWGAIGPSCPAGARVLACDYGGGVPLDLKGYCAARPPEGKKITICVTAQCLPAPHLMRDPLPAINICGQDVVLNADGTTTITDWGPCLP